MLPSPLPQQLRPEIFQHKIVQLYEDLFRAQDNEEKSEGFWREFFLLKPDRESLRRILDEETPDDLLNYPQSRMVFAQGVSCLCTAPRGDAHLHALDTLTTLLSCVLAKRYTNPSFDVINVLVGLENVDAVFTDFVNALDSVIRNGSSSHMRHKAIQLALALTSGAYQTTLLTYFLQQDMFMGIMKFIQECDAPAHAAEAFILLGLLANYNKFEFRNPYQLRLGDFVNEKAITTIIHTVGLACQDLRSRYVEIQDDISEGWTLSKTLEKIGLRSIATGSKSPPKPARNDEIATQMFSQLPPEQAAILLSTFEFAHANTLFCRNMVTLQGAPGTEPPLSSYISLTSYMLQHAYLSRRATYYSHLNLMSLRLLIEDPLLCKSLCLTQVAPVRMCRQRQPHLPRISKDRAVACVLMDLMVDGMNHNLRRRLDVGLYTLCVGILLRIISHLSKTRTRLQYHWDELWRSLFGLIRFFNSYVPDLKVLPQIEMLLDLVVNLIALSLSAGEVFLPGPTSYDDLFYKIVETHDVLLKFSDAYSLAKRASNSIDTLISVGEHYRRILESDSKKLGKLNAIKMTEVIKTGYETLRIQNKEGLDCWVKFQDADERVLLKKVVREVVNDLKLLIK